MNTQVTPVLVSRAVAARMIDGSPETIRRLVKRGKLEEVRLGEGMHPKYRVSDIQALARSEREQSS